MTGLMLKDLLCVRRSFRVYAAATVIYGALGVAGVFDATFFTWFFTLMMTMLPVSFFSLDAAARWDLYALALPVSRGRIVAARYLLALLLAAGALALSLLVGLLMAALGSMADWSLYLLMSALSALAGLVINALMLPLLYRFGAERARLALIAVFGGVALAGVGLAKLLGPDWLDALPVSGFASLSPALAAVTGAVLLALSYLVSLAVYRKKDL